MAPYFDEVWQKLVLYDGECGLCDRLVQWLLRHDRRSLLQFAPLQGETARPFVHGPIATMIFVERHDDGSTRIFERSRGALRILHHLGGGWRVLSWLRVLPRSLTDLAYNFIARNRIRWFGTADACRLPDAAVRARFLP